jgi:serine phosphatase RsbU (regulator of sigma subunit)
VIASRQGAGRVPDVDTEVDFAALFDAMTTPCLVLAPDLRIVTLNTAHERMSGRRREQVRGLPLFEAFPDVTPRPPGQVSDLERSLARVLQSRRQDALPVYRYDVPDDRGKVEERWWSALHLPVLDARGEVALILQRVDEVSAYVRPTGRSGGSPTDPGTEESLAADLTHLHTAVADLYRREQDLHAALEAEAAASHRLQALVQVALQMGTARDISELTEMVVSAGSTVLGADDGAVGVLTEDGQELELVFSTAVDEEMKRTYPRLPLQAPLPISVATVSGTAVVLADERACREWSPELAAAIDLGGYRATVGLPLHSGGQVLGGMSISWGQEQVFDQRDLELMAAFAAQCAQTLQRLRFQEQERRAAAEARNLSEALQRSLLTRPAQPDDLQIAVRYLPAAAQAKIGGDWYDSFLVPSGALTLVIGDVAGHGREAAAVMAQVRNLLRGVSYTLQRPPAAVLSRLDEAMRGLSVETLTSTVLAQVEQTPEQAAAGLRTLRWSNAGHPPPLLLNPDGTARLLEAEPDLFLGLDPATPRFDHTVEVEAGATVVFYTDGLVERRDASLQEGLDWLCEAVQGHQELSAEELCEHILTGLGVQDDDVALLVLHARLETGL